MKTSIHGAASFLLGAVLLTAVAACSDSSAAPRAGVSTPLDASNSTGVLLVVGDASHDFGEQFESRKLSHTFRLENRSDTPIAIVETSTTCACTLSEIERVGARREAYVMAAPIAPGEALDLTATLDTTGKRKLLKSTVRVLTDTAGSIVELQLSTQVRPLFEFQPEPLDLGRFLSSEARSGTIKVTSAAFPTFRLSHDASSLPSYLHVNVAATAPDSNGRSAAWEISVTLGPDAPLSSKLFHPIPLTTDRTLADLAPGGSASPVETKAFVQADVHGAISASPEYLSFGVVPAGQRVSQAVLIECHVPEQRLAIAPAQVETELSAGSQMLAGRTHLDAREERANAYRIELALDIPAEHTGPFRGTLRIPTGSVEKPTLDVAFFGLVGAPRPTASAPPHEGH